MREILFRGLRTDGNGFIEGLISYNLNGDMLITSYSDDKYFSSSHLVIPETVGQYTGLTDKNGVKIFEGDFITGHTIFENYADDFEWTKERPCEVSYDKDLCGFYPFMLHIRWRCGLVNIEVIGNIHESRIATNKN